MRNIIGKKFIFLGISGALMLGSIIAIMLFGYRQGIEFRGGTLWQMSFVSKTVTREAVSSFLNTEVGLKDFTVVSQQDEIGGNSFLIRSEEIKEADHVKDLEALKTHFGEAQELSFSAISPSVGKELAQKAIKAFLFVIFAISFYISFAFRKASHPVKSWKYGVITLVTLFHDALIPLGLFAVLGHYRGVDVDVNFIVAVLVVMGFSVHDTIVVFDRIRENLKLSSGKKDFDALVNESINQTLARSINTSLTLVLVLLATLFLASSALTYFTLTILIGTIVGTYSSIFVASPLLTLWRKKE